MSADIALGNFVLTKYQQLNAILDDLVMACSLGDCNERTILLDSVKQRTNHSGLHLTDSELALMFLGRATIDKPEEVIDV